MSSSSSSSSTPSPWSSSSQPAKQPRTAAHGPNLITILLEKGGGFSYDIVRTISDLLTFEKTSSLVSISKEVYEGELILFKAPKEWLDGDQVRLMFGVMMGTAESRWKMRVDASMVEKLMLGVKNHKDRHKTNDVTPAWLRFLGEQKFPKLISVDLNFCNNTTDAGLMEVGRGCPNLQTLNLSFCRNITDACKNALQQSHPQLSLDG